MLLKGILVKLPSEHMEPLPSGERFCFSCHKGIRCFTDCCRDLNLMLTPYDVMRLRRALDLDSTEFVDRYTVQTMDPDWNVPVLRLKMGDDSSRACPFVSEAGCGVYEDRPGACRAYPLGRAARRGRDSAFRPVLEEQFFLVKEPHCFGFGEKQEWTAEAWGRDQGLAKYNEMNDLWMDFLTRYKPGARQDLSDKQWQMFFMACYSPDRFRQFVLGTRFVSLFDIPADQLEKIRVSDEHLLRFAYRWLAFSLFADPVLKLREGAGG